MTINTISEAPQQVAEFQPGPWLLRFRAMGGGITRFGEMFALQFPETGDDSLIELHNALTIEQRQRLSDFLQAHFGGEA